MIETPELDKLTKAKNECDTQSIGFFLEWLGMSKIMERLEGYKAEIIDAPDEDVDAIGEEWDVFVPTKKSINQLLVDYVSDIMGIEIDLDKVEEERMALLNQLREEADSGGSKES